MDKRDALGWFYSAINLLENLNESKNVNANNYDTYKATQSTIKKCKQAFEVLESEDR